MEKASKKIFPLRMNKSGDPSPRISAPSGFTLIEIMIVLSIVATITGLLLGRIDNTNNRLKESVRQIGVLSRDIRHRARLRNVTYRLVIDMHSGLDSEQPHQYWAEQGSGPILISEENRHSPYEESDEKKSAPNSQGKAPPKKTDFEMDRSLTPKKKTLPSSLTFEDVELVSLAEKVTNGIVYIHYLPEGFVDESAIHIRYDEDVQWTIAIHPLTGKAHSKTEYISLKEILER